MAKRTIPEKPNFKNQLLVSGVVLLVTAIVVGILAKMFVAVVIFILGLVFSIGSQAGGDNTFDKQ